MARKQSTTPSRAPRASRSKRSKPVPSAKTAPLAGDSGQGAVERLAEAPTSENTPERPVLRGAAKITHAIRHKDGRALIINGLGKAKAIAAMCTECMGWQTNPRSCTGYTCPLFPYRRKLNLAVTDAAETVPYAIGEALAIDEDAKRQAAKDARRAARRARRGARNSNETVPGTDVLAAEYRGNDDLDLEDEDEDEDEAEESDEDEGEESDE